MKNDEIKKAVSEIDDKFITEADPLTTKRYGSLLWRKRLQAGLTAAAVVAVAVLGGVTWKQSRIGDNNAKTAAPIVAYNEAAASDDAESIESATDNGDTSDSGNSGGDQVAVAADEKDDKSEDAAEDTAVSESAEADTSANDKTDKTEGNGKNDSKDNTVAAGSSETAASDSNVGKTGNTGSNGNSGTSGNSGSSSGTGSAASTGNNTVASKDTEIASIGEYDRAKSYKQIYKMLGDRYTYKYDGYDYYDLVEEATVDAGDVSRDAMADGATGSAASASESAMAETNDDSAMGSDDYSTTNIMHEGVDEGDIAKTDGKYIYLLQDDCVSITDIKSGKPGKKTRVEVKDGSSYLYYNEMYVHGDVLVVVGTEYNTYSQVYDDDYDWLEYGFYKYNYNSRVETVALCYDISDRTEAKYMGRVKQDGYYNTSRLIGDKFYLFTNYDMYRPDGLTKKQALRDVSTFIPCINDDPIDYEDIYIKDKYSSSCVISSFDIDDCENIIDTKTVVNGYGSIYVSDSAIYFYDIDYTGMAYYEEVTNIGKLILDGGNMKAGGAATVNGYVPDSFAIHEIDGNLMVLTTAYVNRSTTNTMFMFDPSMKEIGKIGNIAKGEYVYAARYLGDYVYFITYRSIDPLFVADISDPHNPKLLGEVEIEGYSDYLHIWDENHVLGLGFETVDNGYGGVKRAGVKLVMFDVTDPLNPTIENTLVLDEEDYSDAISYFYKALLVSPGKNLIGFGTCDYDRDYDEWYSYYLFSYSKEKGFKIQLDTTLDGGDYEYRGLYSGDNFYLVKPSVGKIDHFKL